MQKGILIVLVLFLTMLVPVVNSDSTQQFNKIYLSPFYRQAMNGNVPYSYSFTLQPIDKVADVKSALVTYQVWLNPTVEFFLTVNGEQCNNPSFEVHTTYAGAGEGTVFFDCSNIINKAGTYDVVLTPDDDTGAITGWVDLVYESNPAKISFVGGTEYYPSNNTNETATVFIQVIENDAYVDNASCITTVFHPNGTKILEDSPLLFVDQGIYRRDFPIPEDLGVYPISIQCELPVTVDTNFFTSTITYKGSQESGSVLDTYVEDGIRFETREDTAKELLIEGNATTITINENTTALEFTFIGIWATTEIDQVMVQLYNWSNDSWITLPNYIPRSFINLETTNIFTGNLSDVVNGTTILVRFNDTSSADSSRDIFAIDLFEINTLEPALTPIEVVKSAGELHVTKSILNDISVEGINETITAAIGEILNETLEAILDVNETVTQNQIKLHQVLNYTKFINTTLNDTYQLLINVNGTVNIIEHKVDVINITVNDILAHVQEINSTTHQILTVTNGINDTVNTINVKVDDLNLTLQDILGFLSEINQTSHDTLIFVNDINETVTENLGYLIDINGTVHLNSDKLDDLLVYANDINATVTTNSGKLDDVLVFVDNINDTVTINMDKLTNLNLTAYEILGIVEEINLTTHDNYDILLDVNDTVTLNMQKLDIINSTLNDVFTEIININNTSNSILGYIVDVNDTVHRIEFDLSVVNLTLNQVFDLAQSINATNNQILDVVLNLNLTDQQQNLFLQAINETVGENQVYLQNINDTVTLNMNKLDDLLLLGNYINITVNENGLILQTINITTTATNVVVNQNHELLLNLTGLISNFTGFNFTQALGYLQDINGTVYVNMGKLNDLLYAVEQINQTTVQNLNLLLYLNDTSQDILNDLYQINVTVNENNENIIVINNTVNENHELLVNLTGLVIDVNNSVASINFSEILNAIQNVNETTLEILGIVQDVNNTVYINMDKLNQVITIVTGINSTANSIQTTVENIQNDVTEIQGNITNVFGNLTELISFSVQINTTTQQNQELLNQILANLDANITIILDNLSLIPNATQIMEEILLADVVEFSLSDSTNTLGTGINLEEKGSTLTANAVFGGVAYAAPQDVVTACLDNSTLQLSLNSVRCVNGNCIDIEKNSTITCQYGCNNEVFPNECNAAPFQTNLYVVIALVVIMIGIAVAIKKIL